MQRTLLKAKIHCAVVTHCKRHYENSCAIDEDLLEASGLASKAKGSVCGTSITVHGYCLYDSGGARQRHHFVERLRGVACTIGRISSSSPHTAGSEIGTFLMS